MRSSSNWTALASSAAALRIWTHCCARASRRLAQLDLQLSGLRGAIGDLDEAQRRLATPKDVRPQAKGSLAEGSQQKVERIRAQIAEVKRLLREAFRLCKNDHPYFQSTLQFLADSHYEAVKNLPEFARP